MYVLKGFVANTLFADNTPGVIATLGELSPLAETYSREKGYYTNKDIAPNLLITSFISKDDTTSVPIPVDIATQALHVVNDIYNMTLGGETEIDPTMLLETLIVNYVEVAQDFACGNMVTDGIHTLPEWISWKTNVDDTRPDNFIKLWFTDQAFSEQYDEYEIVIVPPTDVLDNFFQAGTAVETMLKSVTSEEYANKLQAAKQGHPETVIRTNTFNYIDPINSAHVVPSDWGILIYGVAGNNIDSIKDALIAYILANSSYERADWINILPDIFKRTEFILIPLWDQYAIPQRSITEGIYSPQVNLAAALTKAEEFVTFYPTPHIDSHLTTMGHPYKSLAILVIGSPDNRDNKFELQQVFADLIAVTSTSIDFNRMSLLTQNWASLLATMLVEAESMGRFTTLPSPSMMKVVRDNKLFLACSYNNINYLVAAKSNFPAPDEE